MNTLRHLLPVVALSLLLTACSSPSKKATKQKSPPVVEATTQGSTEATPQETYDYTQKPIASRAPLVTEEQAKAIIERFKAAYPKLDSPRMAIYVNRRLIDEKSGIKLAGHTDRKETTIRVKTNLDDDTTTKSTTDTNSTEDRYSGTAKKEAPLSDRQTTRDIERLFGRPFRFAGVALADQDLAAQLLGNGTLKSLSLDNAQAVKDREAIMKIADVVVEILVSSKEVRVAELGGDKIYSVPDLQVTALRLEDARIMGQAASSDVYGGSPSPILARNYRPEEITEATALALMEDMLTGLAPTP